MRTYALKAMLGGTIVTLATMLPHVLFAFHSQESKVTHKIDEKPNVTFQDFLVTNRCKKHLNPFFKKSCSDKKCPSQQLSKCGAFFNVKEIDVGFPIGVHPVPLNDCSIQLQNSIANRTIGYGTNVEPTIAVNPSNPCNIIVAWQNDRIATAGSLEIGIAYSFDEGKTWNRTVVPFNRCIGGTNPNTSDVWLTWSADGKVAYINVLTLNEAGEDIPSGIVVVRSLDGGQTWVDSNLVYSALGGPDAPLADKNSITAHPTIQKYAYSVWDVLPNGAGGESGHSDSYFSQTFDAGKTWTQSKLIYNPFLDPYIQANSNGIEDDNQTIDNILLVLPKKKGGDLLNLFVRIYATQDATDEEYLNDLSLPFPFTNQDYALIRSKDNGATWNQDATIIFDKSLYYLRSPGVSTGGYIYQDGIPVQGLGTSLRSGPVTPIPSVNPKNGYLYAVSQMKAFRSDSLSQIALSTSRDGGYTWSAPVRINRTPQDAPNPQAFTPCVAAMENGYVGIMYCDFRNPANPAVNDPSTNYATTLTDIWLDIYKEVSDPNGGNTGIGLQFVQEVRLTSTSYVIEYGAFTLPGLVPLMTNGDYQTVVTRDNKFYCVYIESFDPPPGGFTPRTLLIPPPPFAVRLDNNRRSTPYVSVVEIPNDTRCHIVIEAPDCSLRPIPLPTSTQGIKSKVTKEVNDESEIYLKSKALNRN